VDFKGLIDFNPRIVTFVQNNYQILEYNVISTCNCLQVMLTSDLTQCCALRTSCHHPTPCK
jgi:hypothetical protein